MRLLATVREPSRWVSRVCSTGFGKKCLSELLKTFFHPNIPTSSSLLYLHVSSALKKNITSTQEVFLLLLFLPSNARKQMPLIPIPDALKSSHPSILCIIIFSSRPHAFLISRSYTHTLRSRLTQSRPMPPTTILVRRRRTRIPDFVRIRTGARAPDQRLPLLPPLLQLNPWLVSSLGANKRHSP